MLWYPTTRRVMCIGIIAALMIPAGQVVLPFVAEELGGIPFAAIEAGLCTMLGVGICELLFS